MKLVPPSLVFLRPFGLYRNACFGNLFVSILCTCCGHYSWYCFISFTIYSVLPFFSLIHWSFSLSSFVIPSKGLKNFIYAASKRCSSLSFSTQASGFTSKFQGCFSYIFIPILYMFWAPLCSSSVESILLIWHLVYVTLCRWPLVIYKNWTEMHGQQNIK